MTSFMRSWAEVQRPKILTLCCVLAFASACDRTPEVKPDTTLPAPPSSTKPEPTQTETTKAEPSKAQPVSFRAPAKTRLVAIGDIHGDLTALRAALRLGGAIDSDDRWVGKDLTVVQTGDQIDRGDQDREVLDVLEKLEAEAKAAGSELIVLNGNHELMNAGFDFRYVTKRSFASFGELAQQAGPSAERLPHDERGRAAAFAPGGPYALKLSRHLTVAVVGDSLFAHGGVLPAHIDYGLERINREASAFLAGKLPRLPAALSAEDAPVWTRLYGGPEVDDATCETLGRVLTQVGAKRLIVGHTVQKGGIQSACSERLFRIDVGLSAFYGDNPPEVLEVTAQGAHVLKPGAAPSATPSGKKSQAASPALHSSP
jgi:hypothetical protein